MSNLDVSKQKREAKKKRVRSFFLTIGQKIEDFLKEGVKYLEMSLPAEKIDDDFIKDLKEKTRKIERSVEIRQAKREDLKSIQKIYNSAWSNSPMPFRPITEDRLLTIFDDKTAVFLIAKMNKIDVGFMLLDLEEGEKKLGIIAGLGILPEYQRHGIGTLLGLYSWYYFKKQGVEELRCEVHIDNNTSYKFIKGLGFDEFNEKIYREGDFALKW